MEEPTEEGAVKSEGGGEPKVQDTAKVPHANYLLLRAQQALQMALKSTTGLYGAKVPPSMMRDFHFQREFTFK